MKWTKKEHYIFKSFINIFVMLGNTNITNINVHVNSQYKGLQN